MLHKIAINIQATTIELTFDFLPQVIELLISATSSCLVYPFEGQTLRLSLTDCTKCRHSSKLPAPPPPPPPQQPISSLLSECGSWLLFPFLLFLQFLFRLHSLSASLSLLLAFLVRAHGTLSSVIFSAPSLQEKAGGSDVSRCSLAPVPAAEAAPVSIIY